MIKHVKRALQDYWGFDSLRPLQHEAMESIAQGRDAIVVLPTGGGKSLCYQAPAVTLPGMAVVVSPLISLMKDQVDALTECGVAGARLDSSLMPDERRGIMHQIENQELKLLYVSPERLLLNGFLDVLGQAKLSFVAIDEAHCVSMWGHDFRPEYRRLSVLKDLFPRIPIGAYTATATEQVRHDIAEQLHLKEPNILIGSFDRPNLTYKVRRRTHRVKQICEVLERHQRESGIIYCIRRRDVEQLCGELKARGLRVAPYHAGMDAQARKASHDQFIKEDIDTIVATVAFGMGIDKSNVRYVIHMGMPKSLEHYQQESGRAGRDSLEAECCLFYSGADYGIWKSLTRDMNEQARGIALKQLNEMYAYCTSASCRHKSILAYFGQTLENDDCGACDICLGQLDSIDNAREVTQMILSCVLRLGQQYGAAYTAQILAGSREQRILENGHDQLSTYGLLQQTDKRSVHDWIEQLAGQGYLDKVGDYHVLALTKKGLQALKGEITPHLLKPVRSKSVKTTKISKDSWQGVDHALFETLRELRAQLAKKKRVPAYVVFGDAALRDMARRRPSTPERFLEVKGVGQKKSQQYGEVMLTAISEYCTHHAADMDIDIDAQLP
jgi:ATP-dependent DNA helicase RecQ